MTEPHSPEGMDTEEPEMNPSSPQQLPAEPFDDYDDGFDEDAAGAPARPVPDAADRAADGADPRRRRLLRRHPRGEVADASSGGASAFARLPGCGTGGERLDGQGRRTRRLGLPGLASSGFAGALCERIRRRWRRTIGSISSVSGNTIYVTETTGNTVKVKLSSATKITKSESVSRKKLYPGDQVVSRAVQRSNGTVHATSVTDSGASSTGSSGTGSSSSTGSLEQHIFGDQLAVRRRLIRDRSSN